VLSGFLYLADRMTAHMTTPTETGTQEATDRHWMDRALSLARRARGRVAPNPAVGAVIVQGSEVVGEGHTEPAGFRHAEIVALDQAGQRAVGATLYVTLEPCAHFGRTPPCLDAVLRSGIARVCIAVRDPNPRVNGKSIEALRQHGVAVRNGVGAGEATRVNAGFFKRIQTGLPEVHVKYAMSLDGKIATRTGNARWITGPEARREAHIIRDTSDAILVGVGTVIADNPRLTTRLDPGDAGAGGPHHPLRVVVDSQARMPVACAMLDDHMPGSTLIAVTHGAPANRVEQLRSAGAEVLTLPGVNERVDVRALLESLGRRGINSLMVEGGAGVIGSLADEQLIDRVTAFIAPVLLGGQGAPSPIAGVGAGMVDHGLRLERTEVRSVGDDLLVTGYVAGACPDEGISRCSPGS
jgi:diaminohydroxyphosphoribosylaminopyrimidine deaminase / 5-amino-6-(5-phosphoribosylamino)uracil reductase